MDQPSAWRRDDDKDHTGETVAAGAQGAGGVARGWHGGDPGHDAGSFGTAIVAVALQSLLDRGATTAFHGAFWWAIGITIAAFIPAIALPGARGTQETAPAPTSQQKTESLAQATNR